MPSIAFPYYDPDLQMFPHLQAILPDLKTLFRRAYICPSPSTRRHARLMDWLEKDEFFHIFPLNQEMQIGERFAYLYLQTARSVAPDETLHLAFVDRLSFALQGPFREQFIRDIQSLRPDEIPVIFERSPAAWETHPQNYREIETFVTTMGRILFGRSLDYAWCHMAVRASQLAEILPRVENPDLSMVAEMVLLLQADIKTRAVDWLAWEDPFILGRDPGELKAERERDPDEARKRLSYALPMIEKMVQTALRQNGSN